jgi:hypothetical protein
MPGLQFLDALDANQSQILDGKTVHAPGQTFRTDPIILVAVVTRDPLPLVTRAVREMDADHGPRHPMVVAALNEFQRFHHWHPAATQK